MGHINKGKNQGNQIPINKISNNEIKKFKDKKIIERISTSFEKKMRG
jgi:hypothetical protein